MANPFAHLIQQLDGTGRDPVRFVGSVKSVRASSVMRYKIDFKNNFGMPCDIVSRLRLWVSCVLSFKSKLASLKSICLSTTLRKVHESSVPHKDTSRPSHFYRRPLHRMSRSPGTSLEGPGY